MVKIQTYVFLDLETTGMPQSELNKTRITELSMVAVKTAHLLVTRPGMTPRVQNKLTLCFNPRRMIEFGCTEVTGLCNDLLEQEGIFDMDAFITINNFIKRLTEPVCLIAHNGFNFDYPILKRHLVNLGVSFPDNLLSADSYHAFYHLLETQNGPASDIQSEKPPSPPKTNLTTIESTEIGVTEMQLRNESTPKHQMIQSQPGTPKKITGKRHVTSTACRRFPWSYCERPKVSYKLKDIYKRLCNRPAQNTHRAEGDCLLMLECVGAMSKNFVEWIDDKNNHRNFSDINPMTLGVPLGQ